MKSIKQLSFIGLVIMLILPSCTMEKRVYMSGYHINWKNQQNPDRQELASNNHDKPTEQGQIEIIQQSEKETKRIYNAPTVNDETITASVDNSIIPINTSHFLQNNFSNTAAPEECDNIILKNGNEISGNVLEITLTEIKYKKCDNLEGPTISVYKSDIFMIKYRNGKKDIISNLDTKNKEYEKNKELNADQEKSINYLRKVLLFCSICGFISLILFLVFL